MLSIRNFPKKIIISLLLTIFVYFFYHVKFIQENVENFSFDILNKFVLSTSYEKLDMPNLLLFKIDDYYLKEKNLLDINNETTYGHLLPRKYIAEIISNFDNYIRIIGKDFSPKGLFIDYDMRYKSDINDIELTKDDLLFIDILKKDRSYIIYLPKTANHNFIENLNDNVIQKKIKNKEIIFVSVGLTVSNDGITRRYYPYKEYFSKNKEIKKYPLISIEIFKDIKNLQENILDNFSQNGISLIENKIIYKNYEDEKKDENYERMESYWNNFKIYSANYPLDMILKEDFKNSILFLGGNHKNNDDFFKIDTFDNKLSGIEIHANSLMTLFYLDGKLKRVNVFYMFFIIWGILFFSEYLIKKVYERKWSEKKIGILILLLIFCLVLFFIYINKFNLDNIFIFFQISIPLFIAFILKYIFIRIDEKTDSSKFNKFMKEDAYLLISYVLLFCISWFFLTVYKQWFNWYTISLLSTILPILDIINNKNKKQDEK